MVDFIANVLRIYGVKKNQKNALLNFALIVLLT